MHCPFRSCTKHNMMYQFFLECSSKLAKDTAGVVPNGQPLLQRKLPQLFAIRMAAEIPGDHPISPEETASDHYRGRVVSRYLFRRIHLSNRGGTCAGDPPYEGNRVYLKGLPS